MLENSRTVSIYVPECHGKDYGFALSVESARSLLKNHYAFGDPSESEYAVSNMWAKSESDLGWRIREDKVEAWDVPVELFTTKGEGHLSWTCPFCGTIYSEDWSEADTLPVLLRCGCMGKLKHFIGNVPE